MKQKQDFMQPIKFIKDFYWERELVTSGRTNNVYPLFAHQGDLDAACAVYSLMMMLMIHSRVNRPELENRQQAQKATKGGYNSYMRLQDRLLSGLPGLYKDGYYLSELSDELKSCFKNKATAKVEEAIGSRCNSKKKHDLTEKIKNTIDKGFPVQIGFSYKRFNAGHSVVAIGYTVSEANLRLLCLDPASEMPLTSFWNAIIDMPYYLPNSRVYSDLYYAPFTSPDSFKDWPLEVTVDEILTIDVK